MRPQTNLILIIKSCICKLSVSKIHQECRITFLSSEDNQISQKKDVKLKIIILSNFWKSMRKKLVSLIINFALAQFKTSDYCPSFGYERTFELPHDLVCGIFRHNSRSTQRFGSLVLRCFRSAKFRK